jgi:hypothetical protein
MTNTNATVSRIAWTVGGTAELYLTDRQSEQWTTILAATRSPR